MKIIKAKQIIIGNGTLIEKGCIVLDDGLIKSVEKGWQLAEQHPADVVDYSTCTVMPGMIDCHVHVHTPGGPDENYSMSFLQDAPAALVLKSLSYVQNDLKMGFTTIRSLSSPAYVDVALRDAINAGYCPGPRIFAAGQGITVTGGHMDKAWWAQHVSVSYQTGVGDGPWGCRVATRAQMKWGANVIKINACGGSLSDLEKPWHQEMTFEEMKAVIDEAHEAGLKVAAHTSGGPGITDAILAGLDSVEHGQWLTDEQIQLMVERNVFYVPTLTTNSHGLKMGKEFLGSSDREWAWMTKTGEDRWDSLKRAKQAGVKICTGTDAGFWVYHGENAMELEELVIGGFTPMEAIQAATLTGAECVGMANEIGSIEPGKIADLVVVKIDPLQDITGLQKEENILQVFQAGKPVKVDC
jgi:imidazolonepropionase-like amidohydrolase